MDGDSDLTGQQVRGSSVLLAGRLISMTANLAIQVLIVRSLSQATYGSFAYALSFVTLAQTFVLFGLDRGLTRFVALYDERGEPGKVLGTITMILASIALLGGVTVLAASATGEELLGGLVADPAALSLLGILMLLAPIQAFDTLATGIFASFGRAGAIFVRRYVLAPALRLAVVLTLIVTGADVTFLAIGYVVAAGLGVFVTVPLLVQVMRDNGLLRQQVRRSLHFPVREILTFSLPLLSTDLLHAILAVADVIVLGYFYGAEAVASLRAVQPVAKLNLFVMQNFALMYTPTVSRLFARSDRQGVDRLYWQTAAWLAVLTFPVFVAGSALARPVTVTLFGQEYASSATLLTLLAFGYYIQAAFGFNGLTVTAYGKVKPVVAVNVGVVVTNVALNLVLVPPFGAFGAAFATMTTLVLHNFAKQLLLRRVAGVSSMPRELRRVYLTVFGAAGVIAAVQHLADLALLPGLALGAVASLVVLAVARNLMDIGAAFPELLRIRVVRLLVGGSA